MTTYENSREHLLDELRRVDLMLRRYVDDWRAKTATQETGVPGLYVADEEVDRILRPDSGRPPASEEFRDRIGDVTAEISARREQTLSTDRDLSLVTLADRFGLTDRQVDALLLALAPELDRAYEKVFAYIQDDIARKRPTVGLILRVLSDTDQERLEGRTLFTESSALVGARLLRLSAPDADAPLISHVVTVEPRVVDFLLETEVPDAGLGDAVTAVTPTTTVASLPVDEDTKTRVEQATPETRAASSEGPDNQPAMRYVYGPPGVGKDDVVAAMCRRAVDTVVRARVDRLMEAGPPDWLDRLVREARLQDGAIHLTGFGRIDSEADTEPSRTGMLRTLDGYDCPVFLSGTGELTTTRDIQAHEFLSVRIPRPGYQRRKALWEQRSEDLAENVDPDDLATKFRLTRGGIDDAITTAGALSNGEAPTTSALYRACRIHSRQTLGSLARKADPTYDWDDIVLPAETMAQLRTVSAHVKHRGRVYSDWGFDDRFGRGTGLNVLFTGPSGTGKTMAAEIIANDAGLDMFRIDLASVVSKYIGETEENLKQVFDEAEHSDAILFFDEADALFAERTEVSDSHDRYANVEVSYLLQRMEDHDGAVILASNLKDNIDDAFLRRINTNVAFPRPDRTSRKAIWRSIFPEEAPVAALDFDFLSEFEITGGNIKNVALTAAFLAADDPETDTVAMDHVVRALERELQKTGRLVDPGKFGDYRPLLDR